MTTALTITDLSVCRGQRAVVEAVSFSVAQGALCVVIGPNGAGKSTLLKAVMGLIRHTGKVEIAAAQPSFGYVPQTVAIAEPFPLTVLEFVAAGVKRRWWQPQALRAQTLAVLEPLGIAHLINRSVQALSGGEWQRVLLAHALIAQPHVLLLDEPTTGLDTAGRADLLAVLADLRQHSGLTLLMVSHDLGWVRRSADQVVCLNRKLICQGEPYQVLTEDNLALAYPRG